MLTVFGSINIDQVISVPSIPLKGETIIGQHVIDTPGGKGANQAVAAARYSHGRVPVVMVGAVGDDSHGRFSLENLRENGVVTDCCTVQGNATGTAIVTINPDGENAIIVLTGANAYLKSEHISEDTENNTTTLLCQGEVSLFETSCAISSFRSHHANGNVIVNLAPVPAGDTINTLKRILDETDTLIVNEVEALSVSRLLNIQKSIALSQVASRYKLQILITRGSKGAELLMAKGPGFKVPSPHIDPIDTTGAGDTFCGVFAALVTEGQTTETATKMACEAAAIACGSIGAQNGMPIREAVVKNVIDANHK